MCPSFLSSESTITDFVEAHAHLYSFGVAGRVTGLPADCRIVLLIQGIRTKMTEGFLWGGRWRMFSKALSWASTSMLSLTSWNLLQDPCQKAYFLVGNMRRRGLLYSELGPTCGESFFPFTF